MASKPIYRGVLPVRVKTGSVVSLSEEHARSYREEFEARQ